MHRHIHMYIHIYIHICIYVCVYTHIYTYTHVHTYTDVYTQNYAYRSAHTYMYIHIYTYTCIYVWVYTYMCIHTRRHPPDADPYRCAHTAQLPAAGARGRYYKSRHAAGRWREGGRASVSRRAPPRPAPAGGVRERSAAADPEGGRHGEARRREAKGGEESRAEQSRRGSGGGVGRCEGGRAGVGRVVLSGRFPAAAVAASRLVSRSAGPPEPAGAGGSAAEAPSPLAQAGLSSSVRLWGDGDGGWGLRLRFSFPPAPGLLPPPRGVATAGVGCLFRLLPSSLGWVSRLSRQSPSRASVSWGGLGACTGTARFLGLLVPPYPTSPSPCALCAAPRQGCLFVAVLKIIFYFFFPRDWRVCFLFFFFFFFVLFVSFFPPTHWSWPSPALGLDVRGKLFVTERPPSRLPSGKNIT